MRTLTSGQLAILDSAEYQVGLRVLVTDADGTYRDYSSQASHNWIVSVDISVDVDQPISQATIKLRRDITDSSGSVLSLAPLRTDSILNRNAALAYAPAIDVGRSVKVLVATVAVGATIVTGDWQNLFEGTIDTHDVTSSTMSLTCRDFGGALADRFIETDTTYGSDAGIPMETVSQQMLDDAFGPGVYTLYCPTSPGFNVTPYPVSKVSVMDAQQALAAKIGWDFRFLWDDSSSAWRPTLSVVDRSKTTPDRTISPSRYFDVTNLVVDRTNIRNALTGKYYDSALGSVQTITVSDATSQAEYGRLWAEFDEGSDSPINMAAEMTAMLDAALADLKDPKADQSIERPFDWSVELGDLDQYSPNGVHYNTAQKWAIVSYQHSLSPLKQRTTIAVRGAPAGKYLDWLSRAKLVATVEDPPALLNLRVIAEDGTSYTYGWTPNDTTDMVWYSVQTIAAPLPADPWDDVANDVAPISATSLQITKPTPGNFVLFQIEARDAALNAGSVHRILLSPGQPPLEYGASPQGTVTVDTDGNWSFSVDGPQQVGSYRWLASTTAYPSDTTVATSGTIVNGRSFTITNGGQLDLGDTVYITIVPFPSAGAAGTAGLSAHILGTYQRVFAAAPQGTVAIDNAGSWSFSIDGSDQVASWRWSASTSAFPADATVATSGTLVNGDTFSVNGGGTLSYGQTVYITAIPFLGVGATNLSGQAVHIRGTYQRVFAASPQGTVSIDTDGEWSFSVDGSGDAASYKYATSTSAFPSDASVASSGTLVNGRTFDKINGGTLDFGDTIYVTVIPYSGVSASGTAGVSIHLRGSYQSYSGTKTLAFPVAGFTPTNTNTTFDVLTNADLSAISPTNYPDHPTVNPSGIDWAFFRCPLLLPDGVTISSYSQDLYDAHTAVSPPQFAGIVTSLYRSASNTYLGGNSATANLGWQTITTSGLTEDTTGNSYYVQVQVSNNAGVATNKFALRGVYVEIDMPTPFNTV